MTTSPQVNRTAERLLVVEVSAEGHYLAYVRRLVEEGRARGHEVLVALSSEALNSLEFELHLVGVVTPVEVRVFSGRITPGRVHDLCGELGASRVVVPNADRFLMLLALRRRWTGSATVTGLVMQDPRDNSSPGVVARTKRMAKRLLLARAGWMRGVRVVWLRPPGHRPSPGQLSVDDPVDISGLDTPTDLLRSPLGTDKETYWFLLVGAINAWKNPRLVLDAFEAAGPPGAGLVIAGKIDPALAVAVKQKAQRLTGRGFKVVVIDRVLSPQEMNQAIQRASCVVTAYSTHAPNSTVGKAAALGTRVVAAGSPTFLRNIENLHVGALTSPLACNQIAENMRRAAENGRPTPRADLVGGRFAGVLVGD